MIWTWIKKFAMKEGIRELNDLKPFVAHQLREAQQKLGGIPPEAFADELVSGIQRSLCVRLGIKPQDVGLKDD